MSLSKCLASKREKGEALRGSGEKGCQRFKPLEVASAGGAWLATRGALQQWCSLPVCPHVLMSVIRSSGRPTAHGSLTFGGKALLAHPGSCGLHVGFSRATCTATRPVAGAGDGSCRLAETGQNEPAIYPPRLPLKLQAFHRLQGPRIISSDRSCLCDGCPGGRRVSPRRCGLLFHAPSSPWCAS